MRKPTRLIAGGLLVLGLIAGPAAAQATIASADGPPNFKAPFACGESWTYSHHDAEVRLALDFINNSGATDGAPTLATAPGTAYQRYEDGGAGNYIVIDHGGGWETYHFHLSSFSVDDGAWVETGQQVGTTGSTGASSGPHQHYEQLYNGEGQEIHINGQSLAPYPGNYGEASITSDNCGGDDGGGGGEGTPFTTWGTDVNVRSGPTLSDAVVTTLSGPSQAYVVCQTKGDTVDAEGYVNEWWSKLSNHGGYVSNIYIDDPASYLPGVPEC